MLNVSLQKLIVVLLWTPEYPFKYLKIIFIQVSFLALKVFLLDFLDLIFKKN